MAEAYVLVVEDEPPNQRMLLRWLATLGYAARAVDSTAAALDTIADALPIAVIADIFLPFHDGCDGLWLLEQIRTQWPSLPVIMASGAQQEDIRRTAQQLGATAFLSKPFHRDLLHDALVGALSKS